MFRVWESFPILQEKNTVQERETERGRVQKEGNKWMQGWKVSHTANQLNHYHTVIVYYLIQGRVRIESLQKIWMSVWMRYEETERSKKIWEKTKQISVKKERQKAKKKTFKSKRERKEANWRWEAGIQSGECARCIPEPGKMKFPLFLINP